MPNGENLDMIQSKVFETGFNKTLLSLSRVRYLVSVCAILWLFSIQITASAAQVPFYQETIIPIPHPITSLLRSKMVHKELGLSATKINEIENLVSEIDLPLWRLRDLPPQKRNEAAAPLINQLKSKLVQILSDRQTERLHQLLWQARGVDVFLEPQVGLRLNLSIEQNSRIRALVRILYSKITSLENNIDISSESQRAASIQRLQAETQRNVLLISLGFKLSPVKPLNSKLIHG